jgi:hypothetical protein
MRENGDTHGDTSSATPESPPKGFCRMLEGRYPIADHFWHPKNPRDRSRANFLNNTSLAAEGCGVTHEVRTRV